MKEVLIAIGSNHKAIDHIDQVKALLRHAYGEDIIFSSVIQTIAVGIDSPDFLNCVAVFQTDEEYETVKSRLKQMEQSCGDSRLKRKKDMVEMDLDILSFNGKRYHQKDWDRYYIKDLVTEIQMDKHNFQQNDK